MDIRDKMKKYGKQFLSQTAKYSKHKPTVNIQKQVLPKAEISKEPVVEQPQVQTEPEHQLLPKTDYNKKFIETFRKLTYTHRSLDVWSDFVIVFACAVSNAVDKKNYDKREELYSCCIKKYNEQERMLFPELAAIVVMALDENPEQDFLGHLYMNLGLGSKSTSQFFTPYHICQLMSEMTVGNISEEIKKNGYVSVNDPCCGAGATLIAAINTVRKQLEKETLNFQNHLLVVAQDIDFTVAAMCYIQISLLGVAGYVKVGNSLSEPICENDTDENYWFTPMYFSEVWQTRMALEKMRTLFEE